MIAIDSVSECRRMGASSLAFLLILTSGCNEAAKSPNQLIGQRSYPALAAAPPHEVLAFVDVTVIDPNAGAAQPNMTVIVQGGRIAVVSGDSTLQLPANARRIDANGRFLIPGLWDSHAHLSYPGECALPQMIAYGVTSARDLGGPPAEGIQWRREIADGRRIGPRLFLAGLNIESASWMRGVEQIVTEQSPDSAEQRIRILWEQSPRFRLEDNDDAVSAVDTAQRLTMDVVKFRNVGSKEFKRIASAARRIGIPLAGHAPDEIDLADAAEAGLGSLEHSSNLRPVANLSPGDRKRQYERIARSGMYVTPTLVSSGMWSPDSLVLATLADTAGRDDPRRRTLSRGQIEMWWGTIRDRRAWSKPVPRSVHDSSVAVETSWVREAYRAGIPILAGTDLGTLLTFPGSSLHEELALLVEGAGLRPIDALRSATTLPARFFGIGAEIGSISPRQRADLVLLNADPLRNIRNVSQIEGVVAAGRYFGASDIASLKECRVPGQ
jgi:imidazolonepropionase-like amidohydrolase